jgi:hypothetical protein
MQNCMPSFVGLALDRRVVTPRISTTKRQEARTPRKRYQSSRRRRTSEQGHGCGVSLMLRRSSQRAGDGLPPGGSGSLSTQIRLFDPELIRPGRRLRAESAAQAAAILRALVFADDLAEVADGDCPQVLRRDRLVGDADGRSGHRRHQRRALPGVCRRAARGQVSAGRRAPRRRGAALPQSGSGLYHTLSPISAAKHVNRIACILGRAGPRFNPREPVAEIIERCPLVPD